MTPISGADARKTGGRSQGGFTLLELLVAMSVAALIAALVAGMRPERRLSVEETAGAIIRQAEAARRMAETTGRPALLAVDLRDRRFQGGAGPAFQAPPHIGVTLDYARPVQKGAVAGVLFFPEGAATGGRITLSGPEGAAARIDIDWLTGMIRYDSR